MFRKEADLKPDTMLLRSNLEARMELVDVVHHAGNPRRETNSLTVEFKLLRAF